MQFHINNESGVPFYRQIVDQIRFAIAAGDLNLGDQLPTVRGLAVDLQINLNTVAKAYRELEIQGVLKSQQGSGTFVSVTGIDLPDHERNARLEDVTRQVAAMAAAYGFSIEEVVEKLTSLGIRREL